MVIAFDEDLSQAILTNSRRYVILISDAVQDMLSDYKMKDTAAKDPLDIYIEPRLMAEQEKSSDGDMGATRPPSNK